MIQRKILIEAQSVERAVRRASRTCCPSLTVVAEEMRMSPRSLQRFLMEQGTSFSQMIETCRRQAAVHLLLKEELRITEIARMLGYSDPSNFGRAVRKWTGTSPKKWRAHLLRECNRGGTNAKP